MEVEKSFAVGGVEARGALCVECMTALTHEGALLDRCGAALCRACAESFYAPCSDCGRLVPKDEALAREGATDAPVCVECFRTPAGAGEADAPSDEEVESLVAAYVALHAEKKRLDAELESIKERLKLAAACRPRVAGAVLLRAGEGGAGVRCSYSVRTSWDAEKLSAVEALVGGDEFAALFERKVTFTAVRETLDAFLSTDDATRAEARALVSSAAQVSETATLNVISPKKKKDSE